MRFRSMTIRQKLHAIVLGTTCVAVAIAMLGNVGGDIWTSQRNLAQNFDSDVELYARYITPMVAQADRAGLQERVNLVAKRAAVGTVTVYDTIGGVLAQAQTRNGNAISLGQHVLDRRLQFRGHTIGSLSVTSNYDLSDIIVEDIYISLLSALAAFLVAALMVARLERLVSAPVSDLSAAIRRTVQSGDFSHRVTRTSDDEVGVLVETFNHMLGELGQRSDALKASNANMREARNEVMRLNADLERRVAERTAELRKSYDDLGEMKTAAEEASKAKSSFLAAMSHEIRTPMNGIIGMADVLGHAHLDDQQAAMVGLIRESAFSLLSIIDDILDFSKIEAGRVDIENAAFSLAHTVRSAGSILHQIASKKGVLLETRVDPALPPAVMGDALRLRQVLINLVGNAIKFSSGMERQGRVQLHAALASREGNNVEVLIRIADNGIGMDKETQARLFSAFSQADASTTRRYGGTGLGLVISRNLVELMGGYLTLRSAAGQGSVFEVRLRLACADAQAAAALPAVPVVATPVDAMAPRRPQPVHEPIPGAPPRDQALRDGRLILVAEDNEANQQVILHQLAVHGYAADIAADGRAALERWRHGDYALVFTDLHMPHMDGYALASAIRSHEGGTRRVPVIALTANSLAGEADRCMAVGMDDYVCKPVSLEALGALLQRWLPQPARPKLDLRVLAAMVGSDESVMDDFLVEFERAAAVSAVAIEAACIDRDLVEAKAQAHKLKSSARSVGAMQLANCCESIESARVQDLVELAASFMQEWADVCAFLEQRLASRSLHAMG